MDWLIAIHETVNTWWDQPASNGMLIAAALALHLLVRYRRQ